MIIAQAGGAGGGVSRSASALSAAGRKQANFAPWCAARRSTSRRGISIRSISPTPSPLPGRGTAFSFYTALRHYSPAPFGAFLELDGRVGAFHLPGIVSRDVRRRDSTRPIKAPAPGAADRLQIRSPLTI